TLVSRPVDHPGVTIGFPTLPGCHKGPTSGADAGCPLRARRSWMGDDEGTMTVFLVLLIPPLLMVFALLMERLERRLRTATVSEADVQEFLDTAQPEEVNTLIREGWTKAFAKSRLRRRNKDHSPPATDAPA